MHETSVAQPVWHLRLYRIPAYNYRTNGKSPQDTSATMHRAVRDAAEHATSLSGFQPSVERNRSCSWTAQRAL